MAKTINTRLQLKKDTSANWETNNPILLNGEKILVVTNAGDVREKIGDGSKTYTQLPFTDEPLRTLISGKVDKVDGKVLSTNDFTTAEKNKLAGIADKANKYVHPGSHPASMITQDDSHRFVSDTEKSTWNAKASTAVASATANGLMSKDDKVKLSGIAEGANKYVHPSYTAKASGLYKVTVDGTGHVSETTAVTKADITALGIPGQDTNTTYSDMAGATADAAGSHGLVPAPTKGASNRYLRSDGTWVVPPDTNTTYNTATPTSEGLMSAAMVTKLNGIADGANKITVDDKLSSTSTNPVQNSVINTALAGKSNTGHTHTKSEITDFPTALKNPTALTLQLNGVAQNAYDGSTARTINITAASIGAATSGHTHTAASIGADVSGAASKALTDAKSYTDTKISNLINGAPETLDTLGEIATAMNDNKDVVEALQTAVGSKANASDLSSHTGNTTVHITANERSAWNAKASTAVASATANGLMSKADKSKLDGIAAGANAYVHPSYTAKASGLYKVTVDGTGHVSATTAVTKADITGLGIPGSDTTYKPVTGATANADGAAGLVPAPAKGAANRYLRSDGTWQVPPDTNTTYNDATTSTHGLMTAAMVTNLNSLLTRMTAAEKSISDLTAKLKTAVFYE